MPDYVVIMEWVEFAARWLHVITAMAWIGSSFYFIALDLGLRQVPNLPKGAHGEEWQVHGGGFYHIQKYLVAPDNMPEHLTWFKWESYMTWLSGAALLMLVYWMGAELYLIDRSKMDITMGLGILISAASLSIGWIIYDALCKSPLGERPTFLMILLFFLLVAMAYGYNQIFTGRATMLHLGAFTATIMSANVFFIIIPNQKIVVSDLKAGHSPDPKYGKIAKLRSTHNNYLTLPVVFLMLSNHYPLAFASEYNWLIAGLIFLMGATIRHYFNSKHARKGAPNWTWLATAILFILVMWLSVAPMFRNDVADQALNAHGEKYAEADGFIEVADIVIGRCSMCHAREPVWSGIYIPPKGIILETKIDIANAARLIYIQSGVTHAMPPANITDLPEEDRARIRAWYQAAGS